MFFCPCPFLALEDIFKKCNTQKSVFTLFSKEFSSAIHEKKELYQGYDSFNVCYTNNNCVTLNTLMQLICNMIMPDLAFFHVFIICTYLSDKMTGFYYINYDQASAALQ